jgi:hypothetical protein
MKKLMFRDEESCDIYNLDGSLPEVIQWLEEQIKQGWQEMEVGHDRDDELIVVFSRQRQETDEEFNKRKKQMEKDRRYKDRLKEVKEKKELELYQKLKRKYEKV